MPGRRAVQHLQMPQPLGLTRQANAPQLPGGGGAGRRWNWLMHNANFLNSHSSISNEADCLTNMVFLPWLIHLLPNVTTCTGRNMSRFRIKILKNLRFLILFKWTWPAIASHAGVRAPLKTPAWEARPARVVYKTKWILALFGNKKTSSFK